MGLIEELGTYLDSQSTRFTIGTDTFLNYLPDEPGTANALFETGGEPPDDVLGGTLPVCENASIALTCRSTSSVIARANVNDGFFKLQTIVNATLSGRSWLTCDPNQSPFLLERDSRGRTVFQVNFSCMRRTTAA